MESPPPAVASPPQEDEEGDLAQACGKLFLITFS